MSFAIFAPNKSLKGGALIASVTANGDLFIKVFKQIANNPDKKNNFDMKKGAGVKFTDDELADIIRAIRTNSSSKFYHTFDDKVTSGNFSYYEIEPKKEGESARRGFGFTVNKGEEVYKVGFNLGLAERFALYLEYILNKKFEQSYNEDIEASKAYAKKSKEKREEKGKEPVAETSNDTGDTQKTESDLDF